jgi:SOS response regulatory protein OraA/RecX
MLQNMEQKKRKREGEPSTAPDKQKIQRTFTQRGKVMREVDPKSSGKQYMEKMDSNLKNVLGSLFSKNK